MVFCSASQGEIFTEIEDNKIVMFEKTVIKEGVLPDKDFGIPDEIAKQLFSGQKAEYIFDQEIIMDIDFFNWSFFPKPIGKIITTRVVYSEKVGWISEILKEKPAMFFLTLAEKSIICFVVGLSAIVCFLSGSIGVAMWKRRKKLIISFVMLFAFVGAVGGSLLFFCRELFLFLFGKTTFFPTFLWWYAVNILAVMIIYFFFKFCNSWNKKRIEKWNKQHKLVM